VTPPDLHSQGVTWQMWLAGAILLVTYIFIFSEKIHRTSAAIIGAVVMIGFGLWAGFYTQTAAIQAIDGNTILLLAGMMMMVAMLRATGAMQYAAIRMSKLSGHHPKLLFVYLCALVSVISMFLDNVTTIVIFAPLTILITRIMNLNPQPYLMAEAMLSNIGGVATLVGDPPNIMIGSAAGIHFTQFLVHMGPPVLLIWAVVTVTLLWLFRQELIPPPDFTGEVRMDESKAIKDAHALKVVLGALTVVIILFFLHHHFGLTPAYVTFIGVALALALLRLDLQEILQEVEWTVLLFFAALFVIVGGVEGSGLLHLLGEQLAVFAKNPDNLLATTLGLLWMAAILSAVVDNIPFTLTMIPIIASLEGLGVNITPLWWALALGAGLGGNGSHIGATANIICVSESERCGIPEARITPQLWLRKGLVVMVVSLLIASGVFVIFFEFFQ